MARLQVRADEELVNKIKLRSDEISEGARDSLTRYFGILDRARLLLVKNCTFSADELALLCDSCNGSLFEAWSIPLLVANIEDSISLDGLDEKWKVDGKALVEKLNALDLASTFALVDAIERFWNGIERGQGIEFADILK